MVSENDRQPGQSDPDQQGHRQSDGAAEPMRAASCHAEQERMAGTGVSTGKPSGGGIEGRGGLGAGDGTSLSRKTLQFSPRNFPGQGHSAEVETGLVFTFKHQGP